MLFNVWELCIGKVVFEVLGMWLRVVFEMEGFFFFVWIVWLISSMFCVCVLCMYRGIVNYFLFKSCFII